MALRQTTPTLADFEEMADAAFRDLPEMFRACCEGLVIRVEEFPSGEVCAEFGLLSPYEILGLYQGMELPFKSVSDPVPGVDMVFLYRKPILAYWRDSEDSLEAIITHVLIHEIGHHFGFSDADMEAIEAETGGEA